VGWGKADSDVVNLAPSELDGDSVATAPGSTSGLGSCAPTAACYPAEKTRPDGRGLRVCHGVPGTADAVRSTPAEPSYELRMAPTARRALQHLPEKVALAVAEFITGPLLENSQRVGKPLHGKYAGRLSARRGALRIIYAVNEAARAVGPATERILVRSQQLRPGRGPAAVRSPATSSRMG